MPTPTAEVPEGCGTETGPGGAAAGRGATSDVTAVEADTAGSGGRYGAENWERERVAGRKENPASESSRAGDGEGGLLVSGTRTCVGIATGKKPT